MSGARKPDFGVFGLALDNKHWKKCGVAWRRTKDGVPYISVSLDFMPRGGQLAIWPSDDAGDSDEVDVPPPTPTGEIPFG